MTDRERLIELVSQVPYGVSVGAKFTRYFSEKVADHLLANGVIVPPMMLGQTCFSPCDWRNEVDECRVSSITQKADGSLKIRITNLHYRSTHEITTDKIGKTVFLTREDAEKALEEMNKT